MCRPAKPRHGFVGKFRCRPKRRDGYGKSDALTSLGPEAVSAILSRLAWFIDFLEEMTIGTSDSFPAGCRSGRGGRRSSGFEIGDLIFRNRAPPGPSRQMVRSGIRSAQVDGREMPPRCSRIRVRDRQELSSPEADICPPKRPSCCPSLGFPLVSLSNRNCVCSSRGGCGNRRCKPSSR